MIQVRPAGAMGICCLRMGVVILGLMASAACATTSRAVPKPFPTPSRSEPPSPAEAVPAPPSSAAPTRPPVGPFPTSLARPHRHLHAGSAIAGTAVTLQGSPYRYGGTDPSGFDCSGFVRYVFEQHGIALPRTVSELFDVGSWVSLDDLLPGDLMFFATEKKGASHVAIALDGYQFVHAPSSRRRGQVRVDTLGSPYWDVRFIGARRVVGGGE